MTIMSDFTKLQLRKFEDNDTLSNLEKIFTAKRGWISKMPKKNSPVIVALSGGLDSICLWDTLMGKYGLCVYPIFFMNQTYKKSNNELASIQYFSKIFKKKYPNLFHDVFIKDYSFSFSFSSLKKIKNVNVDLPTIIHNLLFIPDQKSSIPSLIDAPSRLGIYSFGAFEYAHLLRARKNVSVNTLFFGIIPEDGLSVRESTLSVLRSINLSLCLILGDFSWQILAPIDKNAKFYMGKRELVKNAIFSKLPLDKTWSCQAYNTYHCGTCYKCTTRKDVFTRLNFKDSTIYAQPNLSIKNALSGRARIVKNYLVYALTTQRKGATASPSISLDSKISATSQTTYYVLKNNLHIMNRDTINLEYFNSVGAFIWGEIVSSEPTLSILITKLTKNYNIGRSKARLDLIKFITELEKNEYVKIKR